MQCEGALLSDELDLFVVGKISAPLRQRMLTALP